MSRLAPLLAAVVAVLLTVAGTAPAAATSPFALTDQITDQVGAVDGHAAAVRTALEDLETQHGIRMWVVFVDTFDGTDPQQWADATFTATGLGTDDYLLAVAMGDRQYGYVVDQAFSLDDAALARVATAAERHLAENPPRAVTEAARALGQERAGTPAGASSTSDEAGSAWGMLAIVLGVIAGVVVLGGLALVGVFQGYRDGPGSGYGPRDSNGGSSWWSDSSDSWTSSGGGSSGWSGGGGGGGGGGTRGGSGGF